jgi:signal transduction histidine kinase
MTDNESDFEKIRPMVTLSSRDNGKGLSAEQRGVPRPRRIRPDRNQRAAALLDGVVSIQSEPGEGTPLEVTLGAKKTGNEIAIALQRVLLRADIAHSVLS